MEIQIISTSNTTEIDGVPVRHWKGVTASGIECDVFIHRIAVHNQADSAQFDRELDRDGSAGRAASDRSEEHPMTARAGLITADGHGRYHLESDSERHRAACRGYFFIGKTVQAQHVAPDRRCGRWGCRNHWPDYRDPDAPVILFGSSS